MSVFNRVISRFSPWHSSFCRLTQGRDRLPVRPGSARHSHNAIILAGIALLLNLYAKKFRCPDVLTSITPGVTLCHLTLRTSQEEKDYDAQASHHCRGQWPEQ
ncbi:hypothetical protein ERD95_11635 [Enterobacteriaceae bacterium ML5]|nr:hypothetical protein ERD95_11635 [Enterobacteriaceae bacterium ML5]